MQISVRGFAEVSNAVAARKPKVLKRYKHVKSGESTGRSNYYVKALAAIRHRHKGEISLRDQIFSDLQQKSVSATDSRARAKAANNLKAANAYIAIFGHRNLTIGSGTRLYFNHNGLTVSAQPDLIVEEKGKKKFIKLHCARKKLSGLEVMSMIQLIHLAAAEKGLHLQPQQIEVLEIEEGVSTVGSAKKFSALPDVHAACDEIVSLWNQIP